MERDIDFGSIYAKMDNVTDEKETKENQNKNLLHKSNVNNNGSTNLCYECGNFLASCCFLLSKISIL